MHVNRAEDDVYKRLKDSGTLEEKNVTLRQHQSCYQIYISQGSHCRKYDGKEADNLPGRCKGMCRFSTRTKLDIFDQNNWILQFFKKQRDVTLVKISTPQVLKNIKKPAQTLVGNELMIKVRACRSEDKF